jgi:hypothetical protein
MPPQRYWIDRAGTGDVAILEYAPVFSDIAYANEFFNDRVVRAYKLDPAKDNLGGNGAYCIAHVEGGGAISVPSGCAEVPSNLLAVGQNASITFQNSTRDQHVAGKQMSLVQTAGAPRVSTITTLGCGTPLACAKFGAIKLFHVPAGRLTLTLTGGDETSTISASGSSVTLKPGEHGTLTIPVKAGDSVVQLEFESVKPQKVATKAGTIELNGRTIYSAANDEPLASRAASATPTKQ